MHLRALIFAAALPVLATACAPVPDFADGAAANAPYPKIIPMGQIAAPPSTEPAGDGIDALAARAAQLRARAAALRATTVVDPAAEADLQDALDES